jgi:hypothetical protein
MLSIKSLLAVQGVSDKTIAGGYTIKSIVINGATNVSNFKLEYSQDNEKEFLLDSNDFQNSYKNKVVFTIPAKDIKSASRIIKRDFDTLINASSFPNIFIKLPKEDLFDIINGEKVLYAPMDVIISGKSRNYSTAVVIEEEANEIIVSGKINLLLTDFGLYPQSRLFGLIRGKDEVKIDFIISFVVTK